MCKDGHQWMLLNEISSEGFYKMLPVEKTIRNWSNNFDNGYFIALFAGCREVYRYNFHCDCVGVSSTRTEAEQKIMAEAELKIKAEAELKIKAEAELKIKAEAEQ